MNEPREMLPSSTHWILGRGREPSGGSHRAMEIGPRAVRSAVGRWQAQAVRISLQPGVEMAAAWISLQSGVELQERENMRIETLAHRMSQLIVLAGAYATRVGMRVPIESIAERAARSG